jgi:hypothetical protein
VLAGAAAVVVVGVQLAGWWASTPAPGSATLADRAASAPRTPEPGPSAATPSSTAPETAAPSSVPAPQAPGGPAPGPAPEVAAPPEEAATPPEQDWRGRLTGLYQRRAEALTTGTAPLLDEVYLPESTLLAADRDTVSGLAAAGEALRGFAPEVVSATLIHGTPGAGPVTLRVVDRWLAYAVVRAADPGGPPLRTVGERGEAEVHMTVVATAEGWRISSAELLG